jgi:NAD(P)-dependent dehydrogenase (short-subunit alcohol dehydrogenase family)
LEEATGITLVTGATSGIGAELVKHLASSRPVVIHGRNRERCEIIKSHVPSSYMWVQDLTHLDEIEESLTNQLAVDKIKVENFIHCAGTVVTKPIRLSKVHEIQTQFAVNVQSALVICSALVKRRVNGQQLRNIIFVSSIWGRFGSSGHVAYGASKSALDNSARALAKELSPTVRVNSLALGAISTPMSSRVFDDPAALRKLELSYPLGVGHTRDVVDFVDFLLSDRSRWLTGQVIALDGGRTAHAE